jgi:hypothetical protein
MMHFLLGFLSAMALSSAFFGAMALFVQSVVFRAPPLRYQAGGYSFFVPEGWSCATEGSETVCYPDPGPLDKHAIIIGAGKVAGPEDNYDFYKNHLSKPVLRTGTQGNAEEHSDVLSFGEVTVNGQIWLDSTHRGSEIKDYVTRYMIAKQSALSVLVTYSVYSEQYEANKGLGDTLLKGLEVRALR